MGERDVDQSIGFGVTRNTYSAHSKFSENTQAEKVVDRSGKPEERNSSNAQIRTLLEEQRQMILAEYREKNWSTRTPSLSMPKKNAEFYEKNYGDSKWNFVKFINKVLQRWRNYENSKVLLSIRSQDESSSRTRTLFWNYQAEYKNYKNEVNCMNDSKDYQDAESVRSGNSHVTSRPVSFPPHPIPEGIVETFFRIAAPQRRAAKHLGHTWYIGKRFCKSTCFFFSSLSSRIESMGYNN